MSGATSISLLLLGISIIYFLFQPKKINYFYGYRTRKSMKGNEHWKVANRMAAKGFLILSVFDTLVFFLLTDILKYDLLNFFAFFLIVEFIILFYVVENKLGKMEIPDSKINMEE